MSRVQLFDSYLVKCIIRSVCSGLHFDLCLVSDVAVHAMVHITPLLFVIRTLT